MSSISQTAQARRSAEYAAEQARGREAHEHCREEAKAAVPRILEQDWLPQIRKAAEEGRTITVLQLGERNEKNGFIQRYGSERLTGLGYRVFYYDPLLHGADDRFDQKKVDLTVTW